MSTTLKTAAEILASKNKRGIKDIPETVRSGMRMTKTQLRFCMFVSGVLIAALIVVMLIAGNRATNAVKINEEAASLEEATGAERIEAPDVVHNPAVIEFADGITWSGEGQRVILTQRSTESRTYWLTLCTESEIARFEEILGENRFLELEKFENNSLWIVMGQSKEMQKCIDLNISKLVQITEMDGTDWLKQGTDEENEKVLAAFENLKFFQFQTVGDKKVRLIRGTDIELRTHEANEKKYKQWRAISLALLIIATGVFVYAMKSEKVEKKGPGLKKGLMLGGLGAAVVFLGLTILLSVKMDEASNQMIRNGPMLIAADGAVLSEDDEEAGEEGEELLIGAEASDEKFTYKYNGVEKTVTVPKANSSLRIHQILKYASMGLLGLVVLGLLYFFRHERDLGFPLFNAFILILLMIVTIYPVLNTLAVSYNEGTDAVRGGIGIVPRKFSMVNYDTILDERTVNAAWVSVSKTVIITLLNLFWTGMLAYTLSRRGYVLRKLITTMMVLTMYVNAGLIPNYLLIKDTLNLGHTYLVYIIPTMFSCFNMIVIRTYIAGLPDALVESARIDGAGDFRVYWQIIFPLCTPVLATVALFVAVGSWNSWFDTKLYNNNPMRDPQTLQFLLQEKIATAGQQSSNSGQAIVDSLAAKQDQKGEVAIRAAITVISTVPILVVYPILQKYFVTGMALGSVKG